MDDAAFSDVLEPALVSALEGRGFTSLTAVQRAVLDADADGRDLRISSQTGSGKTVAVGLAIRDLVLPVPDAKGPRALVITPTRELARQVEEELRWLFQPLRARVASVTGGSSYTHEHRALSQRPEVLVGTPGRLVDHLERGTVDLSELAVVVLDEADRMLDMGFREALDAILGHAPAERRTHLVSATFGDEVASLVRRVQKKPVFVEGTRLGEANADIEHIVHIVAPDDRYGALVNVLLDAHDERALVFARTRADVATLAEMLADAGFRTAPLSGEMAQRERLRALDMFKNGHIRVLVATDVAARGLDVNDVTLVVHVDPPTDPDDYVHRSGRTGRAGNKGRSVLLVTPRAVPGARRTLTRARVRATPLPVPSASDILAARDTRVVEELTRVEGEAADARARAIAERVLESAEDPVEVVARLLANDPRFRGAQPHEVRPVQSRTREPMRNERPTPRPARTAPARARGEARPAPSARGGSARPERRPAEGDGDWAVFQVSWGQRHGADPRRLLAMICRRGDIAKRHVGSIRVGPVASEVQIARDVAREFADAARRPDPRDPRVTITRA